MPNQREALLVGIVLTVRSCVSSRSASCHGDERAALSSGGGAAHPDRRRRRNRRASCHANPPAGPGKVDVTILEGGSMLGLGVAYLTTDPLHLLDPRVIYMLADPERPEHFLDRLRARDEGEADPQGFVSRAA